MWWRRLRYLLLLATLCAIATCPIAKRSCTANAREREAKELVDYLVERVKLAIAANGRVPGTAAGPTPSVACCDQGGMCAPEASQWATPGWQVLQFSIDDEHRYAYAYAPAADGRSAIITATGDTDCDGSKSTFAVEIAIEGSGVTVKPHTPVQSPP